MGEGEYIDDPAIVCLLLRNLWYPSASGTLSSINLDGNIQKNFGILISGIVVNTLMALQTKWFMLKMDYVDYTLEENQDRIKPNIWITRADRGHLFNLATEMRRVTFLLMVQFGC